METHYAIGNYVYAYYSYCRSVQINKHILQIQKEFFVFCVMSVMIKFCKCQLPSIFSHLFLPNTFIHGHFTTYSCRLHVTISQKNLSTSSTRSRGVFLGNTVKSINYTQKSWLFFKQKAKNLPNNDVTVFSRL